MCFSECCALSICDILLSLVGVITPCYAVDDMDKGEEQRDGERGMERARLNVREKTRERERWNKTKIV